MSDPRVLAALQAAQRAAEQAARVAAMAAQSVSTSSDDAPKQPSSVETNGDESGAGYPGCSETSAPLNGRDAP